jgi:hypothetical protein
VTAVFNTIVTDTQHADFGMPVSGRVRVAAPRYLPMTTGAVSAAAVQKCALVQGIAVSGDRFGTTDVVVTAAFPGISAWSPPI